MCWQFGGRPAAGLADRVELPWWCRAQSSHFLVSRVVRYLAAGKDGALARPLLAAILNAEATRKGGEA